jgi:dTDP-4-amino-4,6-dideoxygalactose transaminase
MSVPFLDLQSTYLELKEEIDIAIARVLASGWYILGEEVNAFEEEYAAYCEARHCVGVANGLDALHLALLALGVTSGDEVIVPSNTYIATWLAVTRCGAIPVPVEPCERTFNLDPHLIEAALSIKTKVIIPVHLYGQPADLTPILDIARKNNVAILEDAAQAHGARYKGKRIGGHGDAVAWSFYPGKNLGAYGDGGAITTNSSAIAERIRLLRNYGSSTKYVHEICGFNSRLDSIQAAILRVKLKHLDKWNTLRKNIAEKYRRELNGSGLSLPYVPDWADPVWHLFVLQTAARAGVQRELEKGGVATLIHYPIPPHLQRAYTGLNFGEGTYPIAERLAKESLSIPIGPHLSDSQHVQVITLLRTIAEKHCV